MISLFQLRRSQGNLVSYEDPAHWSLNLRVQCSSFTWQSISLQLVFLITDSIMPMEYCNFYNNLSSVKYPDVNKLDRPSKSPSTIHFSKKLFLRDKCLNNCRVLERHMVNKRIIIFSPSSTSTNFLRVISRRKVSLNI